MTNIIFTVKGNWINEWFMRTFATPVVNVDGREFPTKFGSELELQTDSSEVRVSAGIRYSRGGQTYGAVEEVLNLNNYTADTLRVIFRNGFFNHDPFKIEKIDQLD